MPEKLVGTSSRIQGQKSVDGTDRTTTTYEFPYMRKPPKKKTISEIIWDDGKIFGRTCKSWG